MIKQTFKIDYQLKRDDQGRQMLFVSSYQNNIKIEEHFVGYINDILTENKKNKEVIDKAIEYISELDDNTDDTTCYDIDKYTRDYILSILKDVQ